VDLGQDPVLADAEFEVAQNDLDDVLLLVRSCVLPQLAQEGYDVDLRRKGCLASSR
jgi:hypothetical protein